MPTPVPPLIPPSATLGGVRLAEPGGVWLIDPLRSAAGTASGVDGDASAAAIAPNASIFCATPPLAT
eukprot:7388910-Prymnesium_polylepis.1